MNTIPFSQTHPEPPSETPLNDSIIELIYAGNALSRSLIAEVAQPSQSINSDASTRAIKQTVRWELAVEAVHKAVR